MTASRRIGPIGTTARAVGGVLIIALSALYGIGWWDVAGGLVALPLVAIAVTVLARHVVPPDTATRAPRLMSVAVLGPVLGLATLLTFVSPVDRPAIFVFLGASTLLAAARGEAGCEVLAFPNLLLGSRSAVWCPLYAPFDAAERADSIGPDRGGFILGTARGSGRPSPRIRR